MYSENDVGVSNAQQKTNQLEVIKEDCSGTVSPITCKTDESFEAYCKISAQDSSIAKMGSKKEPALAFSEKTVEHSLEMEKPLDGEQHTAVKLSNESEDNSEATDEHLIAEWMHGNAVDDGLIKEHAHIMSSIFLNESSQLSRTDDVGDNISGTVVTGLKEGETRKEWTIAEEVNFLEEDNEHGMMDNESCLVNDRSDGMADEGDETADSNNGAEAEDVIFAAVENRSARVNTDAPQGLNFLGKDLGDDYSTADSGYSATVSLSAIVEHNHLIGEDWSVDTNHIFETGMEHGRIQMQGNFLGSANADDLLETEIRGENAQEAERLGDANADVLLDAGIGEDEGTHAQNFFVGANADNLFDRGMGDGPVQEKVDVIEGANTYDLLRVGRRDENAKGKEHGIRDVNVADLLGTGRRVSYSQTKENAIRKLSFFEELDEFGQRCASEGVFDTAVCHSRIVEAGTAKAQMDQSDSERARLSDVEWNEPNAKHPLVDLIPEGDHSMEGGVDIDDDFLDREQVAAVAQIDEDDLLGFNISGEEQLEVDCDYWVMPLSESFLMDDDDPLGSYGMESDVCSTVTEDNTVVIATLMENLLKAVVISVNDISNVNSDCNSSFGGTDGFGTINNREMQEVNEDSVQFLDGIGNSDDRLRMATQSESGDENRGGEPSRESVEECASMRINEEVMSSDDSGNDENEEDNEGAEDHIMNTSRINDVTAGPSHSAAFRLPTNLEIREGEDYQCAIEELDERVVQCELELDDREYCLWLPTEQLNDDGINDYLSVALGVYGIEQDRALYILYTCQYNVEKACNEIKKRRTMKEEWNEEDISTFMSAFKTYGKRFSKIRKAIPHKSVSQIVNFYYDMKKKLHLRAILDQRIVDGIEDDDTSEASESEQSSDGGGSAGPCENCGQMDSNLRQAGDKNLCSTCYNCCKNFHRRRPRVTSTDCERSDRNNMKCPLKMVDVAESFSDFYAQYFVEKGENEDRMDMQPPEEGDEVVIIAEHSNSMENKSSNSKNSTWSIKFKKMMQEKEKLALRERSRCVRMQHEDSLQLEHHLAGIEKYRKMVADWAEKAEQIHLKAIWSQKEMFQAFLGFRHYGKNFDAIASLMEAKNVGMVKEFYKQHKERVDQLIQKFEASLERNMKSIDFENIFEVVTPQAELVELD